MQFGTTKEIAFFWTLIGQIQPGVAFNMMPTTSSFAFEWQVNTIDGNKEKSTLTFDDSTMDISQSTFSPAGV